MKSDEMSSRRYLVEACYLKGKKEQKKTGWKMFKTHLTEIPQEICLSADLTSSFTDPPSRLRLI